MTVKSYSLRKDGKTKLSANFRVREFACKDGNDTVLIDMGLVVVLQAIRDHFGRPVVINSAYRTQAHNKKVGGSTKSQHLFGKAADIRVGGVTPMELARYAEYLLGDGGGIGLYGTFVHVDVRPNRTRWNQTSGTAKAVSGFYDEDHAAKVQRRFGFADDTMNYLKGYKYAKDLLRKLAESK